MYSLQKILLNLNENIFPNKIFFLLKIFVFSETKCAIQLNRHNFGDLFENKNKTRKNTLFTPSLK